MNIFVESTAIFLEGCNAGFNKILLEPRNIPFGIIQADCSVELHHLMQYTLGICCFGVAQCYFVLQPLDEVCAEYSFHQIHRKSFVKTQRCASLYNCKACHEVKVSGTYNDL